MKIFKNYKKTGSKLEEFDIIRIMENQEDIFVDLPFVVVDFNVEYKEPVIFGNYKGIPTVIEKSQLIEVLKATEIKHFKKDGDKLYETDQSDSEMSIRLPIGTNTDQLFIDNGDVVWAKPEESE